MRPRPRCCGYNRRAQCRYERPHHRPDPARLRVRGGGGCVRRLRSDRRPTVRATCVRRRLRGSGTRQDGDAERRYRRRQDVRRTHGHRPYPGHQSARQARCGRRGQCRDGAAFGGAGGRGQAATALRAGVRRTSATRPPISAGTSPLTSASRPRRRTQRSRATSIDRFRCSKRTKRWRARRPRNSAPPAAPRPLHGRNAASPSRSMRAGSSTSQDRYRRIASSAGPSCS